MLSIVVAAMFNKASRVKKSLVTGNDHIWKNEQPREYVVAKD